MRVLIVTDKVNSAIWRLSKGVQKYNPHIQVDVIAVHPKRPDNQQLIAFERLLKEADIVDFQYWKTFVKLRGLYPEIMNKPKILQHHNPYNLFEEEWEEFDKVVVNNKTMEKKLKGSKRIGNTIDLDTFTFKREFEESKVVQMVSSRIEGKKGVLEVAQACKALGYKMLLIGSISKRDYFDKVMATGVVEFRENVSEEDLVKSYYESAVHVCNSVDDFESGTNPMLEAMSCGTPVLTRNVGHVPDIFNNKNMVVRKGQPEDIDDLKKELKGLMDNPEKRKQIREDAWQTAKTRGDVRRAREYEQLWHEVWHREPLVSVIIPTYNRMELLPKIIQSVVDQSYQSIEIVICNDGSTDGTEHLIKSINNQLPRPIKYVNTNTPTEYNLAHAKNLGVIESSGKILVFMDDRYEMDKDCVSEFVEKLYNNKWLFGSKGVEKKAFIENFSCIYRQDFINSGMFNTSCKYYGFQSQELRVRNTRQGIKFEFVSDAICKQLISSKNKYKKKEEIRRAKEVLYKLGL